MILYVQQSAGAVPFFSCNFCSHTASAGNHPIPSATVQEMELATFVLLLLVLTIISALVALTVVVTRIASRQEAMKRMDQQFRRRQRKMERTERGIITDLSVVNASVRDLGASLSVVDDSVQGLKKRTSEFASATGRSAILVDSRSGITTAQPLDATLPNDAALEGFQDTRLDGDSKEWTYITDAKGKKLLSGGLVANNLVAQRGMQVVGTKNSSTTGGACVSLGADKDGIARVCSSDGRIQIRAPRVGGAASLHTGGGGLQVFGDGSPAVDGNATSRSEKPRSGHAVGINIFVPQQGGGGASWYKLASAPIARVASFHVSGIISYANSTSHTDILVSTVETRDAVRATVQLSSSDSTKADIWKALGFAVVHERGARIPVSASSSPVLGGGSVDYAHLYMKVAPTAPGGLSFAGHVTAIGDSTKSNSNTPSFLTGVAPISAPMDSAISTAVDATMTGTVGPTLDVMSSVNTKFTKLDGGGALHVSGGAVVRGQGLAVGSAYEESAPLPDGVAVVGRRLKVGHNDDSGFISQTVLSAAQGQESDAVGASFRSREGVWSHFPHSNGRTYVRPGKPTGGGIHIGDVGATEVQVAQSWFSRADANGGDTLIRAAAPDKKVRLSDDASAPGGVVLGSSGSAPTLAQSGLTVRGGPLAVGSAGIVPTGPAGTNVSVFISGKERLRVKGDGTGVQVLGGSLQVCSQNGTRCRTL